MRSALRRGGGISSDREPFPYLSSIVCRLISRNPAAAARYIRARAAGGSSRRSAGAILPRRPDGRDQTCPCSRIQRRRARATSGRSCSAARRLFFESNLVTLKEAPDRGAAARNLVLAHRQNHFVQRQVRLLLNQTQ